MRKKYWIALALLFIIPGLLFTTSCAKKTVKKAKAPAPTATGEAAKAADLEKQKAELARQKALEEQRLEQERLAKARAEARTSATSRAFFTLRSPSSCRSAS